MSKPTIRIIRAKEKLAQTQSLLETMDILRRDCPWDRKQTNETLRSLTIEEVYELVDAIDLGDDGMICEELGDVLLHIAFYCKLGEEKGVFDWGDVIGNLVQKLERRHPHIYGDITVHSEEEVKKNWEAIKISEKEENKKSVLGGVPSSLPAMVKAFRMQQKTAQVGFEWKDKSGVKEKLYEEIQEFTDALERVPAVQDKIEEEFGDIFFSLINLARYYKVDPEAALARTNLKFKQRFEYIEKYAMKNVDAMTLEEMDVLWEEAKKSLTAE